MFLPYHKIRFSHFNMSFYLLIWYDNKLNFIECLNKNIFINSLYK